MTRVRACVPALSVRDPGLTRRSTRSGSGSIDRGGLRPRQQGLPFARRAGVRRSATRGRVSWSPACVTLQVVPALHPRPRDRRYPRPSKQHAATASCRCYESQSRGRQSTQPLYGRTVRVVAVGSGWTDRSSCRSVQRSANQQLFLKEDKGPDHDVLAASRVGGRGRIDTGSMERPARDGAVGLRVIALEHRDLVGLLLGKPVPTRGQDGR